MPEASCRILFLAEMSRRVFLWAFAFTTDRDLWRRAGLRFATAKISQLARGTRLRSNVRRLALGTRRTACAGATPSQGKRVTELTKRVSVLWESFFDWAAYGIKIDIDIVVMEGTTPIYYQLKRSADALAKLDRLEAWVAKAAREAKHGIADLRLAIPPDVIVPPKVQKFLDALSPQMAVVRLNHVK
jgi:hypothetical protein